MALSTAQRTALRTLGARLASTPAPAPITISAPASNPGSVGGRSVATPSGPAAFIPYSPSGGGAGATTPYSGSGGFSSSPDTYGFPNPSPYDPGAAGSYTPNGKVLGASTTNFTSVSSPNALTSDILSGGSSSSGGAAGSSGYAGDITVPAANYTDYSGAMASITAGRTPVKPYGSVNPDGSINKFDPNTGVSINPNLDLASLMETQNKLDANTPAPNEQDIYQKQYDAAGIAEKQQAVNDLSATLNAITAKSQAEQLSVVGQGRGIPEAIIGGQQAQIAREAAIQALPVAAQLAAAQGNLQLAQTHLDTMFQLAVKDAQNQYEHRVALNNSIMNFATEADKRRLVLLDKSAAETATLQTTLATERRKYLSLAILNKAPSAVISAITSARTPEEVITAAGQYAAAQKTTSTTVTGEALKQSINKMIATPDFQALSPEDKAAYIQSQGGTPYDFGY